LEGKMRKGSSIQKQIGTTRASDIVATHPCFGTKAHHHFGRIHLPVAPRCNIMCAYCNRRFDCPNESRPGVTSRVMTPSEAVQWAKEHVNEDPRITVAGIAGPGDPLCNDETYETLRLLKKQLPHLTLCLSTNGLLLESRVEELVNLGITNVTITINAVDATIGSKVYLLALSRGKRIVGRQATEMIIQRQLDGLSAAVEKGIFVKVNTVLIPGINDNHVTEIAAAIKQRGAFMMNILPLIPAGSLRHIAPPNPTILNTARNRCGFFLPQMRHCRQCRADAVGLLDQTLCDKQILTNPGQRKDSYRVAVASGNNNIVDQSFGRARGFYIYDLMDNHFNLHEFRNLYTFYDGPNACAKKEVDMFFKLAQLSDCQALICARIGLDPRQLFKQANIRVIETLEPIETILQQLCDNNPERMHTGLAVNS